LVEQRSRSDAPPADKRGRILEVATDEFARKGFAGTRVDEIARLARANKQLVYYYFGGKRGLYDAVLDQMIHESRQRIAAEATCETLREKLTLLARTSTGAYAARWHRLLGWEALAGNLDDIVREDDRRRSWQRHVASVRAAQEAGEIDAGLDPELLALALVSVVIFPHLLPQVTKFVTGRLPTDPELAERYEAFVARLVERL
jgi:TetR/AcrR family transcriptional regulator